MKRFATSITIRARAESLWALLTDAAEYPAWNSTIEKIDGRIAAGETMKLYAKATPGRAFSLKVTEFKPGRGMTWIGGMPMGLFTGTRRLTLTQGSGDAVEFAMAETYTGPLAPLMTRMIPDLQLAFDTFAADLKRRAEGGAQSVDPGLG